MLETILIALLHALTLILFIYFIDRRRPEPKKILARGFLYGILSVVPALILETILEPILQGGPGILALNPALVEEACKGVALWMIIKDNKDFDEHIDAIVYAVCVGVGFAFAENIGYFIMYPESMVMRMMTPGHFIFAVLMGFFLGRAKFTMGKRQKKFLALAFIAPVAAHWFWDWTCFSTSDGDEFTTAAMILFFAIFYIAMLAVSTKFIKAQRKRDDALYAAQAEYEKLLAAQQAQAREEAQAEAEALEQEQAESEVPAQEQAEAQQPVD